MNSFWVPSPHSYRLRPGFTYIYIYRERERERRLKDLLVVSLSCILSLSCIPSLSCTLSLSCPRVLLLSSGARIKGPPSVADLLPDHADPLGDLVMGVRVDLNLLIQVASLQRLELFIYLRLVVLL